MKILITSDLHIMSIKDINLKLSFLERMRELDDPDVIVLAGDIFESNFIYKKNPYKELSKLFPDIPVICTLGNHEFVDHTVDSVKEKYTKKYDPDTYDVHYLDICGSKVIDDVNFVGNVLWYDGSMKQYKGQNIYDWGNGCWLDKRIVGFDYEMENHNCVTQIKENIKDDLTNVLVTHCLPHKDLNGHIEGELSAFSGMKNLLKDINVEYSICGHTHKKVIGLEREGCYCVNVGNDYYPPFEYFLLEI